MNGYTSILKSNRFHALVAFAIVGVLMGNNWIDQSVGLALLTILAGHIGIRTVDRLGEKIGRSE